MEAFGETRFRVIETVILLGTHTYTHMYMYIFTYYRIYMV